MFDINKKSEKKDKTNEVNEKEKNMNGKIEGNKKGRLKKVLSIIGNILIIGVIVTNVIIGIKLVGNPGSTPSFFGKKAFIIVSGSMVPKIQIGDIVIVNDENDADVDDIIAFRSDSAVIVHRIIKKLEAGGNVMFQTKGDHNNAADIELVERDSIEGVYIGKIPFIGRPLKWIYENVAVVMLVAIVIVLVRYYLSNDD